MRSAINKKLLFKLFPKTMHKVEGEATRFAFEQGMEKGRIAQREFINQQIRKHDLKDFDNPALILGYAHAVKAINGELRDVA